MVFNDNLLFQSNLLGTNLDYFPNFLKTNTVVYEIEVLIGDQGEDKVYNQIMTEFDGKSYGWTAYLYFAYRGLLRRLFGTPLPDHNPWAQQDTYLCVGLSQALIVPGMSGWVMDSVETIPDTEMITPYGLYLHIKNGEPK